MDKYRNILLRRRRQNCKKIQKLSMMLFPLSLIRKSDPFYVYMSLSLSIHYMSLDNKAYDNYILHEPHLHE